MLFSTCKFLEIEPVGFAFLQIDNAQEDSESFDDIDIQGDFTNFEDYYAVLGLQKKRYAASDIEIKRHYRRMALVHHPDKKKGHDDTLFKTIQTAWNALSNPTKRRQFDSVDPTFDESIPSSNPQDFYKEYSACFEKESRFSVKKSVPKLGDALSDKQHVTKFYDFWLKFESWRSFEAMDEHDVDSAESREEKRYLDKQNRAARAKLKNKDNARISKLVEQAMKYDPRLVEFKKMEKLEKEERKRKHKEAILKAQEEERKRREDERKRQEEVEKQEKERQKKEKEEQEKKLKEAREKLKSDFKSSHWFKLGDDHESMLHVLCTNLSLLEIEGIQTNSEGLTEAALERNYQAAALKAPPGQRTSKNTPWSAKEKMVLVKAVKMFPGGTIDRWEKIADYIFAHGWDEGVLKIQRHANDCIKMSKALQGATAAERATFQRPQTVATPTSSNTSPPATAANSSTTISDENEWSATQQSALESALKVFPASQFKEDPQERWKKIAEQVPGKSKKQVKLRVKELAELVKKKKQQQS